MVREVVVGTVFFLSQIFAVFAVDFPVWVPLLNIVWSAGLFAHRIRPGANFVLTAAHFGLCLAVIMWTPGLFWMPLTASAVIAVAFLVKRYWGV